MKNTILFLALFFFQIAISLAQNTVPGVEYHLPPGIFEKGFDPKITSPKDFFGFEIGQWHLSPDQILAYVRELDRQSERISLKIYGRSHEARPLVCLTISSEKNQENIEEIRRQHAALANPNLSQTIDLQTLPSVLYAGYSIHGNEASGSNAAMIVAYVLAASRAPEVQNLLENVVVLLDPCFNPDGGQRFSTWVNGRRSKSAMTDPAHDEFNEPWPTGRTNHYGFDLNRDWLAATQPESVGRIQIFHDWQPNVLTDHHEMGSGSTFFFQPGVPSRVNPHTPLQNQELTAKIGKYHARMLSKKQIPFFSGENFDDFYTGKGSTFPDANGCIGILFEQASSRGSAQKTENGLLTFPYSIRNQVLTSFSTFQAMVEMRLELNNYTRDFYKNSLADARRDATQFYVFGNSGGMDNCLPMLEILEKHHIEWSVLDADKTLGGTNFKKNCAVAVPTNQPKYRLVKAMFDRQKTFADSIFYDISAWTLPLAMGLDFAEASEKELSNDFLKKKTHADFRKPSQFLKDSELAGAEIYGFAIDFGQAAAPRLLAGLLAENVRVKVATQSFSTEKYDFPVGTLLIPVERQPLNVNQLSQKMLEIAPENLEIITLSNGQTRLGPDLGSNNFQTIRPPKVALVTGNGANVAATGEVWHTLDVRLGMPPLLIESERLNDLDFSKINTLVLADGNFSKLPAEKIKQFVAGGGTVIGIGEALKWLKTNGLAKIDFVKKEVKKGKDGEATKPETAELKPSKLPEIKMSRRPYQNLDEDFGAKNLPGAIFEAEIDRSHPVCFGYRTDKLPMFFSDTLFLQTSKNEYATPAVFSKKPILAGYVHASQQDLAAGSAAILVGGTGRGRVICFPGDPNFRAFWVGTERLFSNAVFFSNLINGRAVEK